MNLSDFRGLNNVSDPMRLPLGWLVQADNINVTDSGAIARRKGYALNRSGSFSGGYATLDGERMYLIEDDTLTLADGTVLRSGLTNAPMYWCEVNGDVFFNNGVDSGVIKPDHEIVAWRESVLADTPFLDAAGVPLNTLLDPLPFGVDVIQHWGGRIYAAQYFPSEDQTALWFSQPLGFYFFRLDTDVIMLPGRVTMLAPHEGALVIGTDAAIFTYDSERLAQVAEYGVIPGQHWAEDEKRILFWTSRGLCAALPFTNLTDRHVSVAPGVAAGGTIVHDGGQKRFLAVLQQGGSAFNPHL